MSNPLYQRDILSISDLSRDDLELVIDTAKKLKEGDGYGLLHKKVIASCFFEPSTRTRLSFEAAVQRLGGSVIGFSDSSTTSAGKKGETLADSAVMISSYADAIVMRHPQEGAARLASEFSSVPVINGGDGSNQHPTQTLLDLFTIAETQGTLEGLKVAFVGDLKYGRTVHSLAQALSLYGCEFIFLAPDELSMPDYICRDLDERGIQYRKSQDLAAAIPECDIVYMTRLQRERFDETEFKQFASAFVLRAEMLFGAKDNMRVMHPLPRVDEIEVAVDRTPYAYYFEQAKNGVYARQALLALVLNEEVTL